MLKLFAALSLISAMAVPAVIGSTSMNSSSSSETAFISLSVKDRHSLIKSGSFLADGVLYDACGLVIGSMNDNDIYGSFSLPKVSDFDYSEKTDFYKGYGYSIGVNDTDVETSYIIFGCSFIVYGSTLPTHVFVWSDQGLILLERDEVIDYGDYHGVIYITDDSYEPSVYSALESKSNMNFLFTDTDNFNVVESFVNSSQIVPSITDGLSAVSNFADSLTSGFDALALDNGAITNVMAFAFTLFGIGTAVAIGKLCFNWVTGRHGM